MPKLFWIYTKIAIQFIHKKNYLVSQLLYKATD